MKRFEVLSKNNDEVTSIKRLPDGLIINIGDQLYGYDSDHIHPVTVESFTDRGDFIRIVHTKAITYSGSQNWGSFYKKNIAYELWI